MQVTTKNFLFATFEGGGSVTPMLGVVRALTARGHSVRLMSDACNRPESELSGAKFVPWTRAPSKPQRSREFDTWDDWSQDNPAEGFMNIMENVLAGPALAYAQDVIDELKRDPADLVISSEMLFGPPLGCEAVGQGHALLAMNIPLFPIPGFIPLGPGLAPPRNEEERATHAAIGAELRHMLNAFLPRFNEARATLGLGPITDICDQHQSAEAHFFATARAFDFAPEVLPPKMQYVGPLLGDPPWAERWRSPFPANDSRPLALVSFSTTFQNHAGVLQNVIDAIARLPMKAIVTLGGAIRPDEIRGAENVVVVESAPHDAVLREAALVVTHGGHGTVMKALVHGRPLLILPHGRDQEDNATRVATRGAGLRLVRTASVDEIREALSRLIEAPSFTAAAQTLGGCVAQEAAESTLLSQLEQLAAAPPPRNDAPRTLASEAVLSEVD
jgi:MGT family glycosyltransferase